MKDYYQILETCYGASPDEIRKQYRFLLHAWHPDKFPNPEDKQKAQEKTRLINEAFEILGDPQKRESYDRAYPGARRGLWQGSPTNLVDNYEWLLRFIPEKQYSVWLDPGFNPYEWEDGSTLDVQREWHADEYLIRVAKAGKTAIAAFPQALSDILVAVRLRFLPETVAAGTAGILFGITYSRYQTARYYRFGMSTSGNWSFTFWDRSQGEKTIREGGSKEAGQKLAAGGPVRLIAACYGDGVQLGIDHAALGDMIRLSQPVCGSVGVYVACPEAAALCSAGFSSFRPYFIKES